MSQGKERLTIIIRSKSRPESTNKLKEEAYKTRDEQTGSVLSMLESEKTGETTCHTNGCV